LDLLQVGALVQAARHDHLLAAANRGLEQVVAEPRLAVARQQIRRQPHVGGGHRVAVAHQVGQLLENLPGEGRAALVARSSTVAQS
jgi:hypothetical protein